MLFDALRLTYDLRIQSRVLCLGDMYHFWCKIQIQIQRQKPNFSGWSIGPQTVIHYQVLGSAKELQYVEVLGLSCCVALDAVETFSISEVTAEKDGGYFPSSTSEGHSNEDVD
jgi:hypothetical protein